MARSAELYPTGLAARRADLSPERLRQLCDDGRLEHVIDASGRRLIPKAALDALIAERRQRAGRGRHTQAGARP